MQGLLLTYKWFLVGKIEGERSAASMLLCVCEKICTAVAAAQFGVCAVYVCAIQQQFIDAYLVVDSV